MEIKKKTPEEFQEKKISLVVFQRNIWWDYTKHIPIITLLSVIVSTGGV